MTSVRRGLAAWILAWLLVGTPAIAQPAPPALRFTAPVPAANAAGPTLQVSLRAAANLRPGSLRVTLNGRERPVRMGRGACSDEGCVYTARLTARHGLVAGKNVLQAVARGEAGAASAKTRFLWTPRIAAEVGQVQLMLPPSLNLTTAIGPNGPTQPWLAVGAAAFPAYGAGPGTQPAVCATALQLLVIDRAQLTQDSYQCFSDSPSLAAALGQVTANQLAIVATTYQSVAPPGLDTSAIGGATYAQTPAALYPQGYMAIGVGGAPVGQATENYDVPPSATSPGPWAPFLEGLLVEDGTNYNFHWSRTMPFVVDPGAGAPTVTVEATYTPPALACAPCSGLWILVLDRISLQPIDSSQDPNAPCQYASSTATVCGQVFEANDGDDAAAFLSSLTNRNLVFVTGVGQPFAYPFLFGLDMAVASLGGSEYDVRAIAYDKSATAAADTYTLVSIPGEPGYGTSVNGKAVVSTNLNAGQTGRVAGVLMRGLTSMYAPTIWSQESAAAAANNQGMDFSYYELAFQQATPWPLSDTDSQLAAYHYLSSQIAPPDAAAPGLYDYRSYYPGSLLFDIVTNPTDPTQVPAVASFDDPVLGETVAIDPADFSAVAAQLKAEQAALRSVYSLFLASGEASYASVFSAADGAVPLALVGAAAAVQASTLQPTPATTSTINVSNILNMAAGVASIVGVVAPEMGVVSGLLWVASGVLADNPYGDGGAPAIPNPDYGFMTTVSALATGSEQLETNLSTAFGQSLDNILSDWGKLSAAEQHAATDWLAPNQTSLDPVKAAIQQATTQSFYLQLAPRYYQLDTYLGSGVNQILVYSATQSGCWNTYADYPPPAGAYNSFYNGWFNTDILVFSSGRYGISSLGEPTVSYPSGEGAVLDTLFNTLGVSSRELLSVNGPFQRNLGGTVAAAGPNYQLVWSCFGG